MKNYKFTLDLLGPELWTRLEKLCARDGVSFSAYLRRAVRIDGGKAADQLSESDRGEPPTRHLPAR